MKESRKEMEIPYIRIEGYDEYAKDYEKVVQNKEENRLYTEEEIREEMVIQYCAGKRIGSPVEESFGTVLHIMPEEKKGFIFDGRNSNPEEKDYFVRYTGIFEES